MYHIIIFISGSVFQASPWASGKPIVSLRSVAYLIILQLSYSVFGIGLCDNTNNSCIESGSSQDSMHLKILKPDRLSMHDDPPQLLFLLRSEIFGCTTNVASAPSVSGRNDNSIFHVCRKERNSQTPSELLTIGNEDEENDDGLHKGPARTLYSSLFLSLHFLFCCYDSLPPWIWQNDYQVAAIFHDSGQKVCCSNHW